MRLLSVGLALSLLLLSMVALIGAFRVITWPLFWLLTSVSQARSSTQRDDEGKLWTDVSPARFWHEGLLYAIRRDSARPTVHARNLFHLSAAMWDCWAIYSPDAKQYLAQNEEVDTTGINKTDIDEFRTTCVSYAAYRLIKHRFGLSPGRNATYAEMDRKMNILGLNPSFNVSQGDSPASKGVRIGDLYISYGLRDGANEQEDYKATNGYYPRNPPLALTFTQSLSHLVDVNRWQQLALGFFVDQSGVELGSYPPFVCPHWGSVQTFALSDQNRTSALPPVYGDPGAPPRFGANSQTESTWKESHLQVLKYSSWLDPGDNVTIEIGPAGRGNNTLGTNDGSGYRINPKTNQPYAPNRVLRADYARVLAEFWADGPSSETPPGHWNVILNNVSYNPLHERRWGGEGPILSQFQWDVQAYLSLNGAMHDAAVACWSIKNAYDTSRPISALRWMAFNGQSSNQLAPSYSRDGIPLVPDLVEVITSSSSRPGQRHEGLGGNVGKIAFRAWKGYTSDERGFSGVGWILATSWIPYQLPTFVAPPFPGYVSGHSTYSRAAAEVLTRITGDSYFPGGLGEFVAKKNEYLAFELGPSTDIRLQWAQYYDAADESGISRIYGGIHPPMDDFPGRVLGSKIGPAAFHKASSYFPTPARPAILTNAETIIVSVIAVEVAVLIIAVATAAVVVKRRKLGKGA